MLNPVFEPGQVRVAGGMLRAPARSSSKLLPHLTSMSLPVSAEIECALGLRVPGGAWISVW